jgi:hypothetical protein
MWISCRVRSDSHTFSETPFRVFQSTESTIRIHQVRERDFLVSVGGFADSAPEQLRLLQAHHAINAIIIAFNVGTVGNFYWHTDPWVHPVLTMGDDLEGTNERSSALVVPSDTEHIEARELSDGDVVNAALVFGIVARETSTAVTGEYCRGLLLLRMNFGSLNFRKEAFMCFYRALEHFVASRILGIPKLKNELRDMKRAIVKLAPSLPGILDELENLYILRSSQVAHSQNEQRDISTDEVLKIKIFLDLVVHQTFKPRANEMLAARLKR